MPEHALRQLADDAERAADLPEFPDLVHRARQRRHRRRAFVGVAAVGAAAVVAAVLLVPGNDSNRTAPPVTTPKPTHSVSAAPSTHYLLHHPSVLVNQPGALVATVSYASRDDAAALWQICTVLTANQTCPEVVTWTTDGWRTAHAATIPDKLAIYDLPDGSVLVWLYDGGFLLDAHGHRHPVTRSAQAVAAAPGGRYVNLPSGPAGEEPAGMLDTRTDTVHRTMTGSATECVSDARWAAGTLWEYGTTRCALHPRQAVAWTSDLGHTWSSRTENSPVLGVLPTQHRTAILVGARTSELRALDVTTDGGATWHLTVLRRPVLAPDGFAATPDGHLFATAGSQLFASDASWGSFHPVRVPGALGALGVTAADGVVATYGAESDKIAVSDDDGQTWHTVSPRPSS
jgi:hypothetical protein